jgi:hypothetical protein
VRQLFQRRRLGAIARSATAGAVVSEFVGKSPYFQLARPSQDRRAKDDATMPKDEVMALEERLAKLEKTTAVGFFEQGLRIDRIEDRMSALESKIDVVSENLREDIKTVLDAVTAGTEEMRRTTQAIRQEHEVDRRLMKAILNDHAIRIRTLESPNPEPLEPR